jgi:hypothetical protein
MHAQARFQLVPPDLRVPIVGISLLGEQSCQRGTERGFSSPSIKVVKFLHRRRPHVGMPGQVLGQPARARSWRSYAQKIRERQLPVILHSVYCQGPMRRRANRGANRGKECLSGLRAGSERGGGL